jgi:hypothetical protein
MAAADTGMAAARLTALDGQATAELAADTLEHPELAALAEGRM